MFPYSSFHAEHDGDIYFYLQQFFWKLDGLLQPNVSLFYPPFPYPVLSQYIPFYEVRRNIKMHGEKGILVNNFRKAIFQIRKSLKKNNALYISIRGIRFTIQPWS